MEEIVVSSDGIVRLTLDGKVKYSGTNPMVKKLADELTDIKEIARDKWSFSLVSRSGSYYCVDNNNAEFRGEGISHLCSVNEFVPMGLYVNTCAYAIDQNGKVINTYGYLCNAADLRYVSDQYAYYFEDCFSGDSLAACPIGFTTYGHVHARVGALNDILQFSDCIISGYIPSAADTKYILGKNGEDEFVAAGFLLTANGDIKIITPDKKIRKEFLPSDYIAFTKVASYPVGVTDAGIVYQLSSSKRELDQKYEEKIFGKLPTGTNVLENGFPSLCVE